MNLADEENGAFEITSRPAVAEFIVSRYLGLVGCNIAYMKRLLPLLIV